MYVKDISQKITFSASSDIFITLTSATWHDKSATAITVRLSHQCAIEHMATAETPLKLLPMQFNEVSK